MDTLVEFVAVDLDDVLFDFLGHFFKWHNTNFGTHLNPEDMVYSTIWEAWDGTREEAAERVPAFFQEVDMVNILPIDGSRQALRQMKERFRLAIVSARDPSTADVTRAWIDKYFAGVFDQVIIGIGNPLANMQARTKAEVCKKLGSDLLIDDQLRHAIDVASSGIPVLLYGNNPSNQVDVLPTNVIRVEDWAHVLTVLGVEG